MTAIKSNKLLGTELKFVEKFEKISPSSNRDSVGLKVRRNCGVTLC